MKTHHTLMEHEEHGLREVPLNDWAKYRRAGWTFANDKAATLADEQMAEQAEAEAPAEPEAQGEEAETEEKKPSRRRTKPKTEEE